MLGPVFRVVSQADYFDPEFDAGGECDGALVARAGECAGGKADLAHCHSYWGKETEGFKLFFIPLRW